MPKNTRQKSPSVAWDTSLNGKAQKSDSLHLQKQSWLGTQQRKTPCYEPTSELGVFEGLVGYLTGSGLRVFPVYKTESGEYFYLYERDGDEEYAEYMLKLDPKTTKIHSADWFLKSAWFAAEE